MPETRTIPAPLQAIVDNLEGLRGRATIEALRALLGSSPVTIADLEPFVRFKDDHYQRVLVSSSEHYEMLVVCWKSGQQSPIHDHAHSTCCFRVMQGICTETVFDFSAKGHVVERERRDLPEGHLTASQDTDTHQVSNVQPQGSNLVTLHIYSPPLGAMRKYSLTGDRDGDFAPGVSVCRPEGKG